MKTDVQNVLSVDVEDYYQVTNFERDIHRHEWPSFPDRVCDSTRRVLDLLDHYQVQATFFVLGYVAERHPDLVRDIDVAGHEIGSHSYWHRLVYQLTPEEFRADLRRSKNVLEDILGRSIRAFRSPSFSINSRSSWALAILAEEGFQVDSSITPFRRLRADGVDVPPQPHAYEFPHGRLWEFPTTVCRIANRWAVPIAGGGYFRLYPLSLTTRLLDRVNTVLSQPFVFYTHPWEFDPGQPRLKAGTRLQRFRHYVNLPTTQAKFERLLQHFHFGRMDDVLKKYVDSTESPSPASSLAE